MELGAAFDDVRQEVRALFEAAADAGAGAAGVEAVRDEYGYSWLVSRRRPRELPDLVGDLHMVNSTLEGGGFGPQLLCSVVGFRGGEDGERRLGLVYLYKRGTFYPFAPLPGEAGRRDNALELRVRAILAEHLRIEPNLGRWFPLWGAPGL